MTRRAPALTRSLLLGLWLCLPLSFFFHIAPGETQSLWSEDEQRLRLGLKIFPACLGALESLEERLTSSGSLLVLVVHRDSEASAREAAASFTTMAEIRGHPIKTRVITASALDGYDGVAPGGIFIASLGLEPSRLRAWSERHRTLVFSPFAGAVEDGAVAGIYVADRILPFVNQAQARRAGIRFKPFFLDVARRYEGD
ncbi:hypothetical protein [Thiocystis violacea]|uniref:hypothetical protein n=1 Tax=Thiocystis violacea TaxID=13725 RepID=UPI001908E721|nr:hypothetical protein [Thiocystis violacea]MBK1718359.1 hypothetical protein [Thiocystis violacea]